MWLLLILPKRLCSALCGWFCARKLPCGLQRLLMRWYVKRYAIRIEEATKTLAQYSTLADLFVRQIKPELRPIRKDLVSPVDGLLRSKGLIQQGLINDVKGQDYTLDEFLSDRTKAGIFSGASFFNFYLSPSDCHHVFAPCDLEITDIVRIPGSLWPVNDWALTNIKRVLCKNVRLIVFFKSSLGDGVLAMIGAFNVGGLTLTAQAIKGSKIKIGERVGTFHLGSSVVLILADQKLAVRDCNTHTVKYGENLLS